MVNLLTAESHADLNVSLAVRMIIVQIAFKGGTVHPVKITAAVGVCIVNVTYIMDIVLVKRALTFIKNAINVYTITMVQNVKSRVQKDVCTVVAKTAGCAVVNMALLETSVMNVKLENMVICVKMSVLMVVKTETVLVMVYVTAAKLDCTETCVLAYVP